MLRGQTELGGGNDWVKCDRVRRYDEAVVRQRHWEIGAGPRGCDGGGTARDAVSDEARVAWDACRILLGGGGGWGRASSPRHPPDAHDAVVRAL